MLIHAAQRPRPLLRVTREGHYAQLCTFVLSSPEFSLPACATRGAPLTSTCVQLTCSLRVDCVQLTRSLRTRLGQVRHRQLPIDGPLAEARLGVESRRIDLHRASRPPRSLPWALSGPVAGPDCATQMGAGKSPPHEAGAMSCGAARRQPEWRCQHVPFASYRESWVSSASRISTSAKRSTCHIEGGAPAILRKGHLPY